MTATMRVLDGGKAPAPARPDVTVVVPAHDEEASLVVLAHSLRDVLERDGRTFELIVVDDGSADGTGRTLHRLHDEDGRFGALRLGARHGKSAALQRGIEAARGRFVVTMDADLQDLPEELPKLLSVLDGGHFDVVQAWRRDRQDARAKVAASWAFNVLCSSFSGLRLRDVNCGMKAMTAEAAAALELGDDMHRFVPVLLHRRGFRVTEVPVRHARRPFGRSKYGPFRYLRGLQDLVGVVLLDRIGTGRPRRRGRREAEVVETIGGR